MKNTKKGFTLVELLVVIAILAILATVSVVGYTSFIASANEKSTLSEGADVHNAILSACTLNTQGVKISIGNGTPTDVYCKLKADGTGYTISTTAIESAEDITSTLGDAAKKLTFSTDKLVYENRGYTVDITGTKAPTTATEKSGS